MSESRVPVYDSAELRTLPDTAGVIGYGSFGRVRHCFHNKLGHSAVKCFQIQGTARDAHHTKKIVSHEAEIIQNVHHRSIVQVQGITLWSNCFGIIMDFINGGNLDDFILNQNISKIPWGLRMRLVKETCDAIAFLHYFSPTKAVVHGDLKPQNILLTGDLHAKVADFGASQIALSSGAASTVQGNSNNQHTALYSAPEFLADVTTPRTTAMDIYSLAMIIYEIVSRRRVYHGTGVNLSLIISTIVTRNQRPDKRQLDEVRRELKGNFEDLRLFILLDEVMHKCWCQEPSERPSIGTVRDEVDAEFSSVNVGKLLKDIGEVLTHVGENKALPASNEFTSSLNLFSFPFEKANDRKFSVTSQISEPSIIIFVDTEPECCHVIKYRVLSRKFSKLPKLNFEWQNSTSVTLNNCVYVITSSAMFCLNLNEEDASWEGKPPMLTPRSHTAASVLDGKIYVFGGIGGASKMVTAVEYYDPESNTWCCSGYLKRKRFGHSAMTIGGFIYVVGGGNSAVERFDPIDGSVCDVTRTPHKNGFAAVCCDDVIYDIGREMETIQDSSSKIKVVRYSLDCYRTQENKWLKGKSLETNRSQGFACALNGRVFLVGGWDQVTSYQYIEMYEPERDEWSTVASMNHGFVRSVAAMEISN
ncbi:uncharacterized protein LOC100182307 [Ciona intestinalis]